jgi:hypothetical protein
MDKFFLSLNKRTIVAGVLLIALSVWLALCLKWYESYWEGTIRRVQTVDFNMLHHTLPTTLSYLVLTGQDDAIQKVLDSNFGIFGIIITDPKGENIVYKTEKVYHKKTWQNLLSVDFLKQSQKDKEAEHFDLLTDPPPLWAQYANSSPRQAADTQVLPLPKSRVIGRIYYVRQPPPPFVEDVAGSLWGNWFELSGSKRGYALHTLNVIAFALVVILILLWRKQVLETKEEELTVLERELTIKRRALDNLNADLGSQRKRKEWLESEAERAYQRALRLKESVEKLKEAFFFVDMSPGQRAASQKEGPISVRPPLHPPSAVIEEIESLLPDLTNNAKILRSQAEVLQSYCAQLESRQSEMQQIIERGRAAARNQAQAQAGAHFRNHLTPEQSAP